MSQLTDRQQEYLDFIAEFIRRHGYGPSVREIGSALGGVGTNAVVQVLDTLERKGKLTRSRVVSRGIRLVGTVCPHCGKEI